MEKQTAHIIGATLTAIGLGLAVYYGFVYKFSDGLTLFPHLSQKAQAATTPPDQTAGGKSSGGSALPNAMANTPKLADDNSNIGKKITSLVNGLNVRDANTINGKVIGSFNKGDEIGYIAAGGNTDFVAVYNIMNPSQLGFVYRTYTTL